MFKKLSLIAYFLIIAVPAASLATSPCQEISKHDFQKRVLDGSTLIAKISILDYSNEKYYESQWTKIKVEKILYSKNETTPEEFKIEGWQANYYPLYGYNKGDTAIFFLKENAGKFDFTDNAWKSCGPSEWGIIDGKAFNRYKIIADKEENSAITIDELKTELNKYYKRKGK